MTDRAPSSPTDDYGLSEGADPATVATATAETGDALVEAVGIGPGNPAYLTPRAETAIREADVVVGFETVVEYVADRIEGEALACGYRDEADTLDRFAARIADGQRGTAVLMGDPNHSGYQFVGKVERAVAAATDADPAEAVARVVPGISALQVAASRARTPMEETTFVTLHKSGDLVDDLDRLRRAVGERHLLVLPRPYDWMPEAIAAELVDAGGDPDATALVLERLTHDDETVTRTTLGDLAAAADDDDDSAFSDLSVLAVRA